MSSPKTKNLLKLASALPLAAIFAALGHLDAAAALLAGLAVLGWSVWRDIK